MSHLPSLLQKNPRIGTRFTLVELVNTGARGAVFKAIEDETERVVAIKVLLHHGEPGEGEEERRHFLAGSTLCTRLGHPNLVQTLDAGEDPHWGAYQVMEYLKGVLLSTRIKDNSLLPEQVILEIGTQLASVITYIHGEGMLHGDIKPENLFLVNSPGGEILVKLMDFVPKRRLKDWIDLDLTPEYLAPEIFAGRQPGPALDHFAIGVLLFELTFGRLPSFRNNGSLELPRGKKRVTDKLLKLLRGLLSFTPSRRVEAIENMVTTSTTGSPSVSASFADESPSDTTGHITDDPVLTNLIVAMVDSDPIPRLLVNSNFEILYLNETATHLLGRGEQNEQFGKTALAFSVPVLINDLQDAFEQVKVTTRVVTLSDTKTTCWTVPIVDDGAVKAVQIVLLPNMK